jgi:hypothetical protein
MATRRLWLLVSFGAGFVLLSILGWLLLQREYKEPPTQVLPTGWQFYSNPTTLEPVGTVFRIDPEGRKYNVTQLPVLPTTGTEVMGKVRQKLVTRVDVVARFLGIPLSGKGSGGREQSFEFEMVDAERALSR